MQTTSKFSSLENILQIMNSTNESFEDDNHSKSCKNKAKCGHCSELNKMLLSAEQKYSKLLSENYVGQLTIRYLKQKNKELLHKISKNSSKQNQTPLRPKHIKQNKRSFNQQTTIFADSQVLIDTFNPKELKKILSQPLDLQQKENTSPSQMCRRNSMSGIDRQQTYREKPGVSSDKVRKQFNLEDLKKKAQKRLKQTQFYKKHTNQNQSQRKIPEIKNSGTIDTDFIIY